MAGNVNEVIANLTKASITSQPATKRVFEKQNRPISKDPMEILDTKIQKVQNIETRQDSQAPLTYEVVSKKILDYFNNKQKDARENIITQQQYNRINELPARDKHHIELLMYRIIRFCTILEELRIAHGKIKWHYLHYAIVMSFLDELEKQIKVLRSSIIFPVTNTRDHNEY